MLKQRPSRAGGEEPWILFPPLPQAHCMTLGNSQSLSDLHFPQIESKRLDDNLSEEHLCSSLLHSICSPLFCQQLPPVSSGNHFFPILNSWIEVQLTLTPGCRGGSVMESG